MKSLQSINIVGVSSCVEFAEFDLKLTLVTYNDLQRVTQDFNQDLKGGEGGYGVVSPLLSQLTLFCHTCIDVYFVSHQISKILF
jgi:hypothetical protein